MIVLIRSICFISERESLFDRSVHLYAYTDFYMETIALFLNNSKVSRVNAKFVSNTGKTARKILKERFSLLNLHGLYTMRADRQITPLVVFLYFSALWCKREFHGSDVRNYAFVIQ